MRLHLQSPVRFNLHLLQHSEKTQNGFETHYRGLTRKSNAHSRSLMDVPLSRIWILLSYQIYKDIDSKMIWVHQSRI